jgi:hypothetical protein
MSTTQTSLPAEAHLGQALAILQRLLPRLEGDPQRDEIQTALRQTVAVIQQILPHLDGAAKLGDVQAALRQAAAHLEAAQAGFEPKPTAPGDGPVNGELLAVISAAVAMVLDRPYRIVDLHRSAPVVTWINAWAIEGRFAHYSSHRIR